MKIHVREKLVKAGILKEKSKKKEQKIANLEQFIDPITINYEQFAEEILAEIETQDGAGQREIIRHFRSKGYDGSDIQIAMGILQRKGKIVLIGD